MLVRTEILESIHRWDVSAFHRVLQAHRYQPVVKSAFWTSKTADGWWYPLVPVIAYGLEYSQAFFLSSALFLAFALERTVYLIAKKGFKRRRPANILPNFRSLVIASDEFSFPSGHTSAAFLTITTLTLVVNPWFALLYLWAIAVGCSRVVLGVHFPTDILMGAILGSTSAAFALNYITTI
jgi:undecaprenyl-diphosphatase